MDFRYIKGEDWDEFEAEYPAAAAFLRDRNVKREHLYLVTEEDRRPLGAWQMRRLSELNALFNGRPWTNELLSGEAAG